ncbi:adhesin [Streptomyces sp. NPDC051219]|uniref:adhesin n=1 Tax=Streptomyces sp. NPDC051219 TaxID=3155283 RepID=UPI00341B488D
MTCPVCGVDRAGAGPARLGTWIARETLSGRISTFSRTGKAVLAGGVVLTALALFSVSTSLVGSSDVPGTPSGDDGGTAAGIGGAPQRIGPTSLPGGGLPTPSPPATWRPASPAPSKPELPVKPPHEIRPPSYSSWAGPGCAGGHYREHGRYHDGDDGWYTVDSGGYRGSSCDGSFSAVPMSGSTTRDYGNTATWSWRVGTGFDECSLGVYVPQSHRDRDVAGNPTQYHLLADPEDSGSRYRTFRVDQTIHRGSLVSVGSYEVRGDWFAVQLTDRGQDWGGDGRHDAHHAAAQMHITCRT